MERAEPTKNWRKIKTRIDWNLWSSRLGKCVWQHSHGQFAAVRGVCFLDLKQLLLTWHLPGVLNFVICLGRNWFYDWYIQTWIETISARNENHLSLGILAFFKKLDTTDQCCELVQTRSVVYCCCTVTVLLLYCCPTTAVLLLQVYYCCLVWGIKPLYIVRKSWNREIMKCRHIKLCYQNFKFVI
jgi:hypothetical protein